MNDDPLLQRARKRVKLKMGFAVHLLVYLLVNGGLALLALAQGRWWGWQAGPLLGWGLGLAIHGVVTFVNLQGDGLRERLLDQEVKRLRERR
jgi:hypothetical protein